MLNIGFYIREGLYRLRNNARDWLFALALVATIFAFVWAVAFVTVAVWG